MDRRVTKLPSPIVAQACIEVATLGVSVAEGAALVAEVLDESVSLESESESSTRADNLSSLTNEAWTEEAFLHSLGVSPAPETKEAAIHWYGQRQTPRYA